MAVAIIGAGPSGIAAGHALDQLGIDWVGFERHDGVGGIWDLENPGTPMYRSAHLISSRTHSALCDVAMPEDYPDYPTNAQLLAYLRDTATRLGVVDRFRFRTAVDRVEPEGDGWQVTATDADGATTTTRFRGVVMGSGNQWTPSLPDIPGELTVPSLHSRDYRDLDQLRGLRVLVVGAGNSGVDIACDGAVVADRVLLSMRRGYRFVPKHLFGMPTDVFAARLAAGPKLPGKVEQKALTKLLDVLQGDLTRLGLQAPDHDVLATHPIMNTQVLHHLAHGDVEARRDVARFDGATVHFVDGTSDEVDLVVLATGYRVDFPYLDREVFTWRGNSPDLFLNVVSRDHDALFALGIIETDASAWPQITLQARLVARVLADLGNGDGPGDPTQAAAFRVLKQTRPDLSGGIEHVDSPRHDYYTQDAAYRAYVERLLDVLERGALAEEGVDPPGGRFGRLADGLRRRLPV